MNEGYDGNFADDREDDRAPSVEMQSTAALNRSEVEAQLAAAHRYPRSIGKFLKEAASLATISQDVAESCIYTLPRAGKAITGPSVRLAEIIASAYGNLHVGTRVLDAEATEIAAQGVAWDLEKNYRASAESRRRITNTKGERYKDDMITVTGNAAASIAFRNAVFRVVPRSYVMRIYAAVRACAVGDAQTLGTRRENAVSRFGKMGVTKDRVLSSLGKASIEDVTLEDIETLIGIHTAIRDGAAIETHFPEQAPKNAGPSSFAAASEVTDLEAKIRASGSEKPKAAAHTAKERATAESLAAVGAGLVSQLNTEHKFEPAKEVDAFGRERPADPKTMPYVAKDSSRTLRGPDTGVLCPICDQFVGAEGIPTKTDHGIRLRHPECSPFS